MLICFLISIAEGDTLSYVLPQAACFFLKLIRIIGIIQFTNFYNYNLWIKLF